MKIKQTRIRSVESYLHELQQDEQFYIGLEICNEHKPALLRYGFDYDKGLIQTKIPRPLKPISRFNAEGCWEIHRDKPKEPRTFERDYHCVDWHGNDHYGICYPTRPCYPRTRIAPMSLEFTLHGKIIKSPLLVCNKSEYEKIKLIFNLFLEMFGECETFSANLIRIQPSISERTLPWTILPVGPWPWNKAKEHLKDIIDFVPTRQQGVIANRHKTICDYEPTFLAKGDEGFWGYIVYAFPEKELYIFESNRFDNATYIFRGNWEQASQLTKAEIICGQLHDARLIHTEQWSKNIRQKLIS